MRFSWTAFWICFFVHLITLPFVLVAAVCAPMAAFSPNYHASHHAVYWKEEISAPGYIWFGGTYLVRLALDYTIFGGPLPPAPVNPDYSDPDVQEKLKEIHKKYDSEYERRSSAYNISWVASPILWGIVGGFVTGMFKNLSFPQTPSKSSSEW